MMGSHGQPLEEQARIQVSMESGGTTGRLPASFNDQLSLVERGGQSQCWKRRVSKSTED